VVDIFLQSLNFSSAFQICM